jgi:hypothetical protein
MMPLIKRVGPSPSNICRGRCDRRVRTRRVEVGRHEKYKWHGHTGNGY